MEKTYKIGEKVFKIGQVIIIEEDVQIQKMISNQCDTIPKGTKYLVDSIGRFIVLSGKLRGTVLMDTNCEVDGYDIDSITDLIYKRVINNIDDMIINKDDIGEDFEEHTKDSIQELLGELFE